MTSPDTDDFEFTVPPAGTIERLIDWYRQRACSDEGLALALDAQDLATAAEANRKRARAYRVTIQALEALKERCCQPEAAFRGHLKPVDRPKAQVRAPP